MGTVGGFACLCTTLIAVACTQFQKLNLAILDITHKHITNHQGQEHEQVHTIASCEKQSNLNACIQLHQEIKE